MPGEAAVRRAAGHVDDVVCVVLAYLRMLQDEPVHAWIFEEVGDGGLARGPVGEVTDALD